MSLPCAYCDVPIASSEAERSSLCPVCSRPLTVCGNYRLKELLSTSESDRVYSAVRAADGQEVAVKVLLARDDDWSAISEFERIARTLQASKNRTLPQIFGWERGGHGRLILVREKCAGHTLEARVSSGQRPSGALVQKLLDDLLALLTQLHTMTPPLLHRDIRAANILFRDATSWAPVLVDFNPSGPGTIALDLFSLGKTMEAAAGAERMGPVATRLADANNPYASADEALRDLRRTPEQSSHRGALRAPSPAPTPSIVPPSTSRRKRLVWLWILAGILLGIVQSIRHRAPVPPTPPGVKTSSDDATVQRYQKECSQGQSLGCYNLAYRYETGEGIAQDLSRAVSLYQKSCDAGENQACNNLGVLYETGRGVEKDPAHASRLYSVACDHKDWVSCRNLGYLYSLGRGVQHDVKRALTLYQLACTNRDLGGCYNAGVLYENGEGLPRDYARARALYQQACDGEDWEACTNLGWMYEHASGVPTDLTVARTLYEKACDHKDGRGCNDLGVMFGTGKGVPLDEGKAFAFYEMACKGDDYFGCSNLGYFYEAGKAIDKDMTRAVSLYQKSCKLGYDKACTFACDDGDDWSCDEVKRRK